MHKPDIVNHPLVTWVTARAQDQALSFDEVLKNVFDGLEKSGLPLARVHISFIPRHPQSTVGVLQWFPGQSTSWSHAELESESGRSTIPLRNPLQQLRNESPSEIRVPLRSAKSAQRYRLTADLAAEGYTDYFGIALDGGYPKPVTLTFMTHCPDGFSEQDLIDLRTVAWALQIPFQRETIHSLTRTIASTYIGQSAGQRVVAGEMHRGQTSRMNAVIWFSDLRGFTELAQRSSEETLIQTLNIFFDTLGECIEGHGGEILKFMGDAILAVFPYEGSQELGQACRNAVGGAVRCLEILDSLNKDRRQKKLSVLRSGIGLHRGEVVYGNIGTQNRLDFTILGQPVNIASRIESRCAELGELLLVSKDVAEFSQTPLSSRGLHHLRGVSGTVELFGLTEDRVFESSAAIEALPPLHVEGPEN